MIDLYLQAAIATWPADLQALGNALRIALPVVLIVAVVLLIARALQRWIDSMERDHPHAMRTADAQQLERDVEQIYQHWYDTIPPEQQRPHLRAGANQFPRPADERRQP